MFTQSDPEVITATLAPAGFEKITVVPAEVSMSLGATVDDAVQYVSETGVGRAMLDTIPTDQQTAALDAVGRVLSAYADSTGVHLSGAVLLTTAIRP
jgi:hypothetical protein